MNEQQNVATVRAMYDAFGRRDIDTIVSKVADDLEWTVPYERSPAIPQGGSWHGKDGFLKFFRALADSSEFPYFAPQQFVAQGDDVVALGEYTVHAKSTGRSVTTSWVHVWKLRDGKPVRGREFADTAAVRGVFEAQPASV